MSSTTKVAGISCLTPNDPVVIEFANDPKRKQTTKAASRELIERVIELCRIHDYVDINSTRDIKSLPEWPASIIENFFKVDIVETTWDTESYETTILLESIDGNSSHALLEILCLDWDIIMTADDPEKRQYGVFEWRWKKWEGIWQIERRAYFTLQPSLEHIDTLRTSIKEEATNERVGKICTYLQKHKRMMNLLVHCLDRFNYPERNELSTSVEELCSRWEGLEWFGEWPIDEEVVEAFNDSLKEHQRVCDSFSENYEKRNAIWEANARNISY